MGWNLRIIIWARARAGRVRRWFTALHGDSESFRFTISPFLRIVIRVAWPRLKDQKTNIRKSVVANAAAVF